MLSDDNAASLKPRDATQMGWMDEWMDGNWATTCGSTFNFTAGEETRETQLSISPAITIDSITSLTQFGFFFSFLLLVI